MKTFDYEMLCISGVRRMDVIMIAIGAGFIGLSYFYALVCDRL